jgi:predicted TIM-barrel enzyme
MARSRAELVAHFHDMASRREPIVGGGAGTGLSAKWEEAGGIDLIVIYNSGRYRMAGRGSLAGLLAYGNANDIVVEMAHEVLPVVRHTPVLAGVNGTDPFYLPHVFLGELQAMGFAGVQNFPTVGLIDGVFRQNLEETGMGYALEVDMIRLARELELLTTPYVFSEDDAAAMAEAGADIVVCHMGLTTGGSIGAETGTDAGRLRRAGRTAGGPLPAPPGPTCSCCATAARSPSPSDATYVLQRPRTCTASTAPRAWSGCPPSRRSRPDRGVQSGDVLSAGPSRGEGSRSSPASTPRPSPPRSSCARGDR